MLKQLKRTKKNKNIKKGYMKKFKEEPKHKTIRELAKEEAFPYLDFWYLLDIDKAFNELDKLFEREYTGKNKEYFYEMVWNLGNKYTHWDTTTLLLKSKTLLQISKNEEIYDENLEYENNLSNAEAFIYSKTLDIYLQKLIEKWKLKNKRVKR